LASPPPVDEEEGEEALEAEDLTGEVPVDTAGGTTAVLAG
jgi:hypothetical protein